jgi:hypothetical protein
MPNFYIRILGYISIASLNPNERESYFASLKQQQDGKNIMEHAITEAVTKNRRENCREFLLRAKGLNLPQDVAFQAGGNNLTVPEKLEIWNT